MNKKIFPFLIIFAFVVLGIGPMSPASAAGTASLSFDPETKNIEQGKSFNLNIIVHPNGELLDTGRAFVSFPADLLTVENFSLGELFPNVSPGNIIDNKNGYLSEGGFRKGSQTSESGVFGTITFSAKKEGRATVQTISGSRLISIGEEKINLAGLGQAVIEIKAALVPEFLPEVSKIEIPAKEEKSFLEVKSSSHPSQISWYNINKVVLNWEITGVPKKTVSSYFYALDKEPVSDSDLKLGKEISEKIFENIEDGVWYFHLKVKFTDGSFSEVVHFKVMVDTVPPGPIVPVLDQTKITEGENTYLRFGTTDQTSDIAYFEVGLDNIFSKQRSPYLLKNLSVGEHTIAVRATDMAGNSVLGETKINVAAKPSWEKYGKLIVVLLILLIVVVYLAAKKILKKK